MTPPHPEAPLTGVRVLDLTNVLAGPFCAYHLAALGADVIQVEEPRARDLARALGADPDLNRRGMGASYLAQNAGKRSLAIDLTHPDGVAALLRLVDTADVLVENFRPGVMRRLGLGDPRPRQPQPRPGRAARCGRRRDRGRPRGGPADARRDRHRLRLPDPGRRAARRTRLGGRPLRRARPARHPRRRHDRQGPPAPGARCRHRAARRAPLRHLRAPPARHARHGHRQRHRRDRGGPAPPRRGPGRPGRLPVRPGASGNVDLIDLVHAAEEIGWRTGIDLDALIALGRRLPELTGLEPDSRVLVAGKRSDLAGRDALLPDGSMPARLRG